MYKTTWFNSLCKLLQLQVSTAHETTKQICLTKSVLTINWLCNSLVQALNVATINYLCNSLVQALSRCQLQGSSKLLKLTFRSSCLPTHLLTE